MQIGLEILLKGQPNKCGVYGLSQEQKRKKKDTLSTLHKNQKSLLERIITATTNKGNIVLDPFCGSGTTGVVALRQGLSFIGIDLEKKYLDSIAIPRIKDALKDKDSKVSRTSKRSSPKQAELSI